jgi:hypothetical protein
VSRLPDESSSNSLSSSFSSPMVERKTNIVQGMMDWLEEDISVKSNQDEVVFE